MKRFGKVFAVIMSAVMIFAAVSVFAAPAQASEPVAGVFATTTGGEVMGYTYDGVDNYFAIPYGQAERFMPAVPASVDRKHSGKQAAAGTAILLCNTYGMLRFSRFPH